MIIERSEICQFYIECNGVTNFMANDSGQDDASKDQYVQPTGICTELKMFCFMIDPAVVMLAMIASCDSLFQTGHLFNVNTFSRTFGIHTKGKIKSFFGFEKNHSEC